MKSSERAFPWEKMWEKTLGEQHLTAAGSYTLLHPSAALSPGKAVDGVEALSKS